MALVRRRPAASLPSLQNRINRLFDEMFPVSSGEGDIGIYEWKPVVDTYEKEDAVVIKAELPGVEKNNISIDVSRNILTLKGERREDKDIKEDTYHRRERFYGKFQRSFTLPEEIDAERVDARFKEGVLEITVPKTEPPKRRKVQIK